MSGGSGVLMALTVKERGGVVYSVDPCFVPDSERPEFYSDFPILGSLEGYLYAADKFGCEDIMIPLAGTTEEVLPRWPSDRKLDLVYIDGDHTYECVKSDLQWLQFAKEKAIVAFDDWIVPVAEAVDEYMNEHKDWKLKLTTIPRWYVRNEADD